MSDLLGYYERLLDLIKSDVDTLLQEEDLAKRNHKQIKTLLEMAADCEAKIENYEGLTQDWDRLPREAKEKILKIIEDALGGHHAKS